MDEQTGDPFSVKNQLLHSKLHFDTGRVKVGGRGGWVGTCICCLKRSHKRLRPHESIRSHTCALSLISAECKHFNIHLGDYGMGRDGWEGGVNYVQSRDTASHKSTVYAEKKHSGKRGWGKKLFKVLYGLCDNKGYSNPKWL